MRRKVYVETPMSLRSVPIDAAVFAPFGEIITAVPDERLDVSRALDNRRPQAAIYLSTSIVRAVALPLALTIMERHAHSSQSFIPLNADSYLVCVAPPGANDLPDIAALRAFVVPAQTGITYGAGVWHHPMAPLRRDASFAILMWCDRKGEDEEFVDIAGSVTVENDRLFSR